MNGFSYGFPRGNGLQLAGSIGGTVNAIVSQGNYCYSAEGSTFLILDITTPSVPTVVARLALPGLVRNIALFSTSGHLYAVVADDDAGLQIVDVTVPMAPILAGYYNTGDQALGVSVLGGYAYVGNGNSGIMICDISAPAKIQKIGALSTGGFANNLAVRVGTSGILAFVINSGALVVVDVSSPQNPVLRGQTPEILSRWYNPGSIALFGNRAYLAANPDSLQAVDISNPDAPTALGPVSTDSPNSVAIFNSQLYTWGNYLTIYSISGGNLQQLGYLNSGIQTPGTSCSIVANSIYCAGGPNGIMVYSINQPSSPQYLGSYATSCGSYASIDVSGNTAYVAAGTFKIFNANNPASPSLISQFNQNLGVQIEIQGSRAFLLNKSGIVSVLDVSSPNQTPVLLGATSPNTFFVFDFYLSGNLLVAGGYETSSGIYKPAVAVFNISNPANISIQSISFYDLQNRGVGSITGNGNIACVSVRIGSGSDFSLSIENLNSSGNPSQIGQVADIGDPTAHTMRLTPDNHYLLIGCYSANWKIVDVRTNSSPLLVSSNSVDSTVNGIDFIGSTAVIAEGKNILMYDISNPVNPILLRSYNMPGIALGVKVSGNSIYVANDSGGLVILNPIDTDPPEIFITSPTFAPKYTNYSGTIDLGGASDDNLGLTPGFVSNVSWSNNRGGSGIASGTTSWFVSGVVLQAGTNLITLTATDQSGNTGTDLISVVFNTTNQDQSITFPPIAATTFGNSPITIDAAASSGLPVNIAVISGPATLTSSNVLVLNGAGKVTVQASQPGNNSFNPAPSTNVSFNVALANQAITFSPIPNKSPTDSPLGLTAAASSGLPVYFSVLSGPAAINSSNFVTLLGAGTVSILAWQPGNSNYNAAATVPQSFTVSPIPQTIAFGALSQQRSVDAPFPIYASASSSLPISFSILSGPAQLIGNILTLTGAGTVIVRASQTGNSMFAPAGNVDQSLTVLQPINTVGSPQFNVSGFNLTFYGTVGSNYIFQASTNLANWTPIINFICTNNIMTFKDTSATGFTRRFYRMKSQ